MSFTWMDHQKYLSNQLCCLKLKMKWIRYHNNYHKKYIHRSSLILFNSPFLKHLTIWLFLLEFQILMSGCMDYTTGIQSKNTCTFWVVFSMWHNVWVLRHATNTTHQAQVFANPNFNKIILSKNLAIKIVENHSVSQKFFRYRAGFQESKILYPPLKSTPRSQYSCHLIYQHNVSNVLAGHACECWLSVLVCRTVEEEKPIC